jgi:hypothetical protein
MVELNHDKNFIPELSQSFRGIDEAEVQALYGVLDSSDFVYHLSHNSADPGTKHRSFVYTRVYFFDGRIKWSLFIIIIISELP